ncbi:putative mitogen-activated protein kinase kinase kinase A-like [Capsicum annuum]|uniref:mitogen-activated protein kinase kinase kinase n=1 Tax=Capsicum annuum TaxID=4072 RepID=A0A1U8H7U2_CAPAN|nr:mitogen-activated protein kinase kinase kinase 18-like [Capsicum annuum]KAF3652643.1 putative mitogen-activated protein kinase kinase kinase A-like [Capsicum annuum]KAF3654541.1 putative mitogen-activated protein kinase kinase kinase A-like [Capsicum annuum]PHT76428.1 hypothetical protein T459_19950 [Capsicum annuum]
MDWTRGHTIGHGSSAAVSIAKSRCSDEVFAVKSVELSQSQFLQKEQKILSQLSSPYVVSYKGYDVTKENDKLIFNLMMEYMSGGTFSDEIRKQGGRINEPLIGYYAKQIVQGLDYLHSRGIAHCDIKGQNILLGKTGAKIADFGCARCVDPAKRDGGAMAASAEPVGGTPLFMAPEVARGEEQGCPADIWALGCTIIEMATGRSPWTNVTNTASLLYRIAFSGEYPEIPKSLSVQATDFLSKCLRRDARERWTAKQLLNHPFLEESNSNSTTNQHCVTSSPTSILDQDIWNSVEESDTIDPTIQTESSMDSPLQRISKLGQNSGKPNWCWTDEIWTTVRKTSEQNEGNDDKIVYGIVTSFSEMQLESCLVAVDLEINYLNDNFCCNDFPRHLTYSANKIQCL